MEVILSSTAPRAIGPYVHAIRTGNLLYCSGQTPIDPESMKIVSGGIENQTRRVIENLKAVLSSAGLSLHDVVKVNVYLTDMQIFSEMNSVYEQSFGTQKPARTTVAVKGLPLDALIEIECIAEFK